MKMIHLDDNFVIQTKVSFGFICQDKALDKETSPEGRESGCCLLKIHRISFSNPTGKMVTFQNLILEKNYWFFKSKGKNYINFYIYLIL